MFPQACEHPGSRDSGARTHSHTHTHTHTHTHRKGQSKYVPNYSMSDCVLTATAPLFSSKFERVNCTLVIKARKSSAL